MNEHLPNPEQTNPNAAVIALIDQAVQRPDVSVQGSLKGEKSSGDEWSRIVQLPLDNDIVLVSKSRGYKQKGQTDWHIRVPGAIGIDQAILGNENDKGFFDVQYFEDGTTRISNVVTKDGMNTREVTDNSEKNNVLALASSTLERALAANPLPERGAATKDKARLFKGLLKRFVDR